MKPSAHKYIPIIKGKDNDLKAMVSLSASARQIVKPFVEITPVPEDSTVDSHIVEFTELLIKHTAQADLFSPSSDIFVDLYGLLPNAKTKDGQLAVISGFSSLIGARVIFTPVYGFQRDDNVWKYLPGVISKLNKGFCFRLEEEDIDEVSAESTWEQIAERLAQINLLPADVDLLIDLQSLGHPDKDLQAIEEMIIDFLALRHELAPTFRSIIIAGTSALPSVTEIAEDGTGAVIRNELIVWARLQAELGSSYTITFGDYGIVPAEFSAAIPSKNANAKIKYTAGDKIYYFRGHKLVDPPYFSQFHILAKDVMRTSMYRGKNYSYGDGYICNCATGASGPGNLGSWVLAGMNQHIEYTAHQLSVLASRVANASSPEIALAILGSV